MPPYGLPAVSVVSGIKSNSTKGGGGYNAEGYEGFGHLRLWSHRRNGSGYEEGGHSRYMSHQRTQSWKKDF